MKKKKNKKEENVLIDLRERENIKIIHSRKNNVTDDEILEFENRLSLRYNSFNDFTEKCIQRNMEKNKKVSEALFISSMKSMLEQNEILKYLLKDFEQEN